MLWNNRRREDNGICDYLKLRVTLIVVLPIDLLIILL